MINCFQIESTSRTDWKILRVTALCFIILTMLGCTSGALRRSTGAVASEIGAIIEQQAADNLGRYKERPGSFPSQAVLGQGAVTIQNSITPTLKAPYTLTQKSSKEADLGATMQWQEAWTITPVMDNADLRRLKFVYTCAVGACPKDDRYDASASGGATAPTVEVVKTFFKDNPPASWLKFAACPTTDKSWKSLGTHHGFEICVNQDGFSQFTFLLLQLAVDTQSSNKTKGAFLAL
jgi:hypothetical protein